MNFETPIKKEVPKVPEIEVRRETALEVVPSLVSKYKNTVDDEEALFIAALGAEHPEWREALLNQLKKHKSHVVLNAEEFQGELIEDVNNTPVAEKNKEAFEKWEKDIPELKSRIEKDVYYFNPKPETSEINKLTVIPSDGILPENSGRGFSVGKEMVVMSHTGNLDNAEHEFLHGVINPITERLSSMLSDEERERISELSSGKLREDYGDYKSILNETLIRTYNNYIKKGEEIRSYEKFDAMVHNLSPQEFKEVMKNEETVARFGKIGIETLADFRGKVDEYYEAYEKDELRNRVFMLYKEFNRKKEGDQELAFEDFLSKRIKELVS